MMNFIWYMLLLSGIYCARATPESRAIYWAGGYMVVALIAACIEFFVVRKR